MKKQELPKPTEGELELLTILWERGQATVREIFDAVNTTRPVVYTGVLKLLQIMADKGILARDESQMKHIYRVAEDEQKTKDHLLEKFVNSMYKGSASKLVMQLLGNKKASKEDMASIKEILDKLEKK